MPAEIVDAGDACPCLPLVPFLRFSPRGEGDTVPSRPIIITLYYYRGMLFTFFKQYRSLMDVNAIEMGKRGFLLE
ncbi:MAG: hypothetical protein ACTSUE_20355 [Promethearchaeota archaeon]